MRLSTFVASALTKSFRTESHFHSPSTSHIYLPLKLKSHFTRQLYNACSNYTFHGDKYCTLCYSRYKKYIIRFINDKIVPSNLLLNIILQSIFIHLIMLCGQNDKDHSSYRKHNTVKNTPQ